MADATAFHDLSAFVGLPRLAGLALSPDGRRLITSASGLSSDGTRYVSALWEVDPGGVRDAVRLTRSACGESAPAFLPDGSLVFLSSRPDPDPGEGEGRGGGRGGGTAGDRKEPALWRLPERGEARRLLARGGGVAEYAVARDAGRIAFAASLLPGAADAAEDARLREAREKAKVAAILYESGPVRHWDTDLGPGVPHVFVTEADTHAGTGTDAGTGTGTDPVAYSGTGAGSGTGTGPGADFADADSDRRGTGGGAGTGRNESGRPVADAGARGQIAEGVALSPDGSLVAYGAFTGGPPQERRFVVVVADAATGKQLRVLASPDHEFTSPAFNADGSALVCVRETRHTWDHSGNTTLWEAALDDSGPPGRDLLPDFDQWPASPVVSRTGDVFFTADEQGRSPVFRLAADGTVTRLTASGAYTDVVVAPDGTTLYALRTTIDSPPAPVRLSAADEDQEPSALPSPGGPVAVPGTLTEVMTTADDGAPVRAWLALPDGASADTPVPLLVFVHGGPQTSWCAWHWRWNPWTAAARGYAVLLPDPALSTGYGQRHHERGWTGWGQQPYRDVLALTDAALARPDLDADRTALLGGSYGGYLANWAASRTGRFRAIVSHAGLWNLTGFAGGADHPDYFRRIFGDPLERGERYEENSPHLRAGNITTPMLVIHGANDFRVPVGEAMALWYDLTRFEVPAKYLYFPDEHHWILSPNNARLWYSTVLNFLDHHVLGTQWHRPELL